MEIGLRLADSFVRRVKLAVLAAAVREVAGHPHEPPRLTAPED